MPLPVFGYLRVPAGMPEASMAQDSRKALEEYAESKGYVLAEIFIEHDECGSSAFAALMDALKRSEQPIVIVPSMCHFARLPGLRSAMREHIELETDARVVVMHDIHLDEVTAGQ